MRSLTVSYCTFLLLGSVFVSHFAKANEHGTYRRAPTRSSKHAAALSHALMCSESYPCCYGCQQYLRKNSNHLKKEKMDRGRLSLFVSGAEGTGEDALASCPCVFFLATQMGAGGHQVAKTETAAFQRRTDASREHEAVFPFCLVNGFIKDALWGFLKIFFCVLRFKHPFLIIQVICFILYV